MTQNPQAQDHIALHLYEACALTAVAGVNEGETLGQLPQLCAGDVYRLSPRARRWRFLIQDGSVASGAAFGKSGALPVVTEAPSNKLIGAQVMLQGNLQLMTPEGDRVDLALIALWVDGREAARFVLPRSPIAAGEHHILLNAEEDTGPIRLCDITPVAFARGTQITLSDGQQRAVEDLSVGDLLLTRDSGAKPIRWIGHRALRAVGSCAPVLIRKGFFANERDLLVSQYQRLYLPHPNRLAGTKPLLIPAIDLLFQDKVTLQSGGSVDYFHIALDAHEIIYAEYIPTESLLIGAAALDHLPEDLGEEAPEITQSAHPAGSLTQAERELFPPETFRKDGVRG